MPLLLNYIFREHLKILALCTGILATVYVAIDFFEKIGRFVQYDAPPSLILLYFGLRIPKILYDVIPLGTLLATLITLGILSRNNEIVAMKSSGVSLLYVTSPILGLALGISLLLAAGSFSFLPATKQKSDFVRVVKIRRIAEQSFYGLGHYWFREGQRLFANVQFVDPVNHALHDVSIYRLHENYTLEESIRAKRIEYENGGWMMHDGRIRAFGLDGTVTERAFTLEPIALARKPGEFKELDVDTDKMKFFDLKRYIDRLKQDGYDVARYQTDLYGKIALPFVNFIMSLIAISFGLHESRGRGIARGVGLSLLIGGAYLIIHSIALSMGHTGLIPPLVAGGFADLLFLAAGVYLYLGIRQ
ncbi:MAG TPA: LPS export ABC transporter permease LptG [Nitrospiria bacterium]